MKHSVSHTLGRDTARTVVRKALDTYAAKFSEYSPTSQWVNDDTANISFTVKGISLKGSVAVAASSIDLDLDVPLLLRPFKGKALEVIEGEIQKWIAKAKNGELN